MPLEQIADTLQVYLGSAYVNDFDFNNRSYRVYVQADRPFRDSRATSASSTCAREAGALMSLDNLVAREDGLGAADHQPLQPLPLDRDQRHAGAG